MLNVSRSNPFNTRSFLLQTVGVFVQIQNNKELLAELQPALELKITRKAALEAELKNLTAEIEADKKKITELPESTEKFQKEATTALIESNQLKTKLSTLSRTQEADQKLHKLLLSNICFALL
jgi:predicted nuclease with TOPRIM domain